MTRDIGNIMSTVTISGSSEGLKETGNRINIRRILQTSHTLRTTFRKLKPKVVIEI